MDPIPAVPCIVVANWVVASQLHPQFPTARVIAAGAATMGARFSSVTVATLPPTDPLERISFERWIDTCVRTRLVPGGAFVR